MPATFPADSVGIVKPQTLHFDQPLTLQSGKALEEYTLVVETYGQLNAQRNNALLVCHALSGDHHAAGYTPEGKAGWWETAIGPGKPIDTNLYFVVALNNLGGCAGSTGPTSINPRTGKPYGQDFPIVTVKDWVNSQYRLMERLGITKWAAIVGGSLGGMQALQWAIDYPDKMLHTLIIAGAPKLTAQNIAFNVIARAAILSDPDFHEGRYYENKTVPARGLRLARMLGHITYQSDDAMGDKFGRELSGNSRGESSRTVNTRKEFSYSYDEVEFQVESYLHYQGQSFVDRFDANTYLLMTKALDYFDPAAEYDHDLAKAFARAKSEFLVVSFTSDWRFPPQRSREIVKALLDADRDVSYAEIDAKQGHDAFLLKDPQYMRVLSSYLKRAAAELHKTMAASP
ncbi:MAG TPA: homoserine O-acetyltransferase [Gammaproteobacteria bacterium]